MEHHHAASTSWLDWFAGGGRYMDLTHCMGEDWLWIAITVILDIAVAIGYGVIAMHWWRNQRALAPGPAKTALGSLRNIFIFCGLCGYIFIPIKMVWPAWRLYDIFMAVLVYFTWRYAWGARQLKVLYTELEKTEKLTSDLEASRAETKRKSFFLNAISHDMRTPLNGLVLQADLAQLSADSNDPQSLREALAEIKEGAKATADLLNSFLELGRLDWSHDQLVPTEIELRPFLQSLVGAHQAAADQKGLALRSSAPAGLAVRTDRVMLERILANLVSNAIKFTSAGSVTIHAEASGGGILLDVIDTGVGIAPEHQDHLFQEFFQVQNTERDRRKGFGLGLAISRRLARQMGGDLEVQSEPGCGSRFRLGLPNVAGRAAGLVPAAQAELLDSR